MARRSEPDYVSGAKGRYEISPPILHPAFCVCAICPKYRERAAAKLRTDAAKAQIAMNAEESLRRAWASPLKIRARRACPAKIRDSRPAAMNFAEAFRRAEEERLNALLRQAEEAKRARANAVPFSRVCDAYRNHLQADGKRYDRDKSRIDLLEKFFGADRDVASLDRDDYARLRDHLGKRSPQTVIRYTTTLVAMMNSAVRDGLIPSHHLHNLQRPRVKRKAKPVAFTSHQVAVLLGPAMAAYEREEATALQAVDAERRRREAEGQPQLRQKVPTLVPLRGFCILAYVTLMRPSNNFGLRWSQVHLDPSKDVGSFRLDEHKNSSKGVEVEGGLHPMAVRYLRQFWPGRNATGLVHPNPTTGEAYVNIRAQWKRLIEIANVMLPNDQQLTGSRTHFYTWRHTGASEMAAKGADPVMVARMMGDTSLKTVMDHYFDSSVEHMQEVLARWEPVPSGTREERGEERIEWAN